MNGIIRSKQKKMICNREWSRRGLNPRLSYGTSFVKFLWINVIHRFSTMSIFGCLFAPAYVRSIKMETQGRSNIMI